MCTFYVSPVAPRINEKYADFVSLSSRMQGVERALKPLRAPLEDSSLAGFDSTGL
jgi:hypothetical protein